MKLISKIVVGIVFCSMTMPLVAQQMEEPKSLLSPNVATLGSFREPEVALYTGTPSISIPLFEIPLQDYVLPIELQYNGTSILVDQPPGWVGLGWNLSAGGVITRKVNDVPDDHLSSSEYYYPLEDEYFIKYYRVGFFYSYQAIDTSTWSSFEPRKNDEYFYPIAHDSEPDEFSFVFPGYRGSFYLNHKGEWVVRCSKPVSVKLIPTFIQPPFYVPEDVWCSPLKKQPSCFAGFIITIEDGTQFVFGNNTNAIDFNAIFFDCVQVMHANAWHLTKIILPDKQEISFSYQRQSFTNHMYYNFVISDFYKPWQELFDVMCGNFSHIFDSWEHIEGKLISPVYLREIHTPILSVSFSNSVANDLQYCDSVYLSHILNYSNNNNPQDRCSYIPYLVNFMSNNNMVLGVQQYLDSIHENLKRYKLDSIAITYNSSLKKVKFRYIENSASRLALEDVIFSDNSAYHFEYNNLQSLPRYISFKTDYWGYYNNDNSAIYNHWDTINYISYLTPNSTCSKYGLLTAIYHPTGGVTRFEYESNDYQKQVQESRWELLEEYNTKLFGGGVRIKNISHYENENDELPVLSKEYFYTTNYIINPNSQQSSGILGERFRYSFYYPLNITPSGDAFRKVFSSISVLPQNRNEASVCYSEVTEKVSSGGYIVYKFSNYSDYLDEEPLNVIQQAQKPYGKYTSLHMNRGLLLSKTKYDNQKQLLYKKSISYTPNKSSDSFIRSLNWIRTFCTGYGHHLDEGSSYKIYTHTMVPDTIREVWYSASGDSIVKITQNDYNLDYQMPTKKEVFTSTDTISELYRYPFDIIEPSALNGPFANEQEEVCAGMVNNHIYLPWEVVSKKGNKVTGSTCFHYSKYSPNPQKIFYEMDSVSILGITEPIASISPVSTTQKDNLYIVPAKQSCRYDSYGNVIEIVTDGIPTAYVWGFNHSYVVAKVIGITYAQVQSVLTYSLYHQLITSTNPSLTALSSFRSAVNAIHPTAQCFTYQYNPLYGITSETDPSGHTVFYEYDSMGRLQEAYYRENNEKRILKKYRYDLKTFTPTPQPGIL